MRRAVSCDIPCEKRKLSLFRRSPPRQRTKQEIQLDHEYRIKQLDVVATTAPIAIRTAGFVGVFWLLYLSVESLAGQYTTADIGIKVLADLKVSQVLAWLFGAGGVGYGWRQRKLKQDTIERYAPRVQQREREVDPKRTSSRLTQRGTTRAEDKE